MKYIFSETCSEGVFVPSGRLYKCGADVMEYKQTAQTEKKRSCCIDYGFLTEENAGAYERLQIPELNSGFTAELLRQDARIMKAEPKSAGMLYGGFVPLTFVTDVLREGSYSVKIELKLAYAESDIYIFLGRRRLARRISAVERKRQRDEHIFCESFVTNICPIIPRGHTEEAQDLTLDVTLLGEGFELVSIEAVPCSCKTLYIAGDSTVTDQSAVYPYLPSMSYGGWGQMLSCFMGNQYAVSNHAHSGLTSESFRTEGHYKILLNRIGQGDVCLFQFGHNDQKLDHLKASEGYRENMLRYICEIKQKGALPVLVTPLARNSWRGDDGTYNDLLAHYSDECVRIAGETGIPVIKLHERSMEFITEQGRDKAKCWFYPSDYTHSNDYGAYLFASCVYEELAKKGICKREAYEVWEPGCAGVEKREIPAELAASGAVCQEKLFENLERPNDLLTRFEAFGLVIAAMRYFPTNVYNDMFDDVIGHETYAGTVECAYQNGLIPGELISGRKIYPEKKVTGGEFILILMNGYKSRKPLPGGDTLIQAAIALSIIPADFPLTEEITRRVAADMCEKVCI